MLIILYAYIELWMDYEIKKIEVDEESLLEVKRFLNQVFPKNKKFTLDFIRWQYAQNPLGVMEGFNAWDKGWIVSHFAALPISMIIHGKARKGLLCINVSTDERYQGKKLFTTLGQRTIEKAKSDGYDFMIAVPNANSSHAFLKYFGFYLVSPLTVKVGFGKDIFVEKDFVCYKLWDDAQWNWRLANPTNKYSFEKNIIYSPISFFAKTISSARTLNVNKKNNLTKIGFRPLNLYIGLGADLSKGVFFNIPSFVKRPPFNLVFRDFTEEISQIGKDDIFLQLIDLDTI